jgi:hypothetical protein
MNDGRCRSCGCTTSADSSACPGQLGLGGTCRCHRVGASYEPVTPSTPPSLVGILAARLTYLDADGRPEVIIVEGPAVIETWDRKPEGGIVHDSIKVRPWAAAPPGALPSGGPRLPPNEVAPQLLANVRERGDNWGDLANATADELRDALQLAAGQLNARDQLIRDRLVDSGPYMIGLWADELNHVEPCDCDLDEENAGTNCMANSEWTYAVLAGGGSFAPEPVVKLPRTPPISEDDAVPDLAELLTRVDPEPNAG